MDTEKIDTNEAVPDHKRRYSKIGCQPVIITAWKTEQMNKLDSRKLKDSLQILI